MTMTIRPLSGGRLRSRRALFFPDALPEQMVSTPVACFLVEHPRGRVLFDTGVHHGAAADPVGRLGAGLARRFVPEAAGGDIVQSLAALQLTPDDVTHVVNSHLHFDHCGCNACFGRAQVFVQRADWDGAVALRTAFPDAPRDWDAPLDYRLLEGEHDLFGDGAVVAFPTPGHTAGHQSLRVRTGPGRSFVMTGDAVYTAEHLERDLLPPPHVVAEARAMAESMSMLRRLRDRDGATLLFSHDAAQWDALGAGEREIA